MPPRRKAVSEQGGSSWAARCVGGRAVGRSWHGAPAAGPIARQRRRWRFSSRCRHRRRRRSPAASRSCRRPAQHHPAGRACGGRRGRALPPGQRPACAGHRRGPGRQRARAGGSSQADSGRGGLHRAMRRAGWPAGWRRPAAAAILYGRSTRARGQGRAAARWFRSAAHCSPARPDSFLLPCTPPLRPNLAPFARRPIRPRSLWGVLYTGKAPPR